MEEQNEKMWIPWANLLLIAINVLVFLWGALPETTGRSASILYRQGALFAPLLLKGQDFYRLVTAIFLHADAAHLFNNMIVQFAGGEIAERNLGHFRYAVLYLLSGIIGNVVSVFADYLTGSYAFSVGASGAVFGVIGALLYLILYEAREQARAARTSGDGHADAAWYTDAEQYEHRAASSQGTGLPQKMKSLLIRAVVMTAWLLYSGWSNPSVNQAAHVGGLLCGFLLAAPMMHARDRYLDTLM